MADSKDLDKPKDSQSQAECSDVGFKLLLRDISPRMVEAWNKSEFGVNDKYKDLVEISKGDIFINGPSADAIVSPANSFGYMDGGIDMAYSRYFGWQMMNRLREVIKEEHSGELLVGDAIIIPAYPPGTDYNSLKIPNDCNEGKPIKYLISAPTMRVPLDVSDTVNAYLALRASLLAVKRHNKSCATTGQEPIRSILCPGLGTAVGRMPFMRCAIQMVTAYEAVVFDSVPEFTDPSALVYATMKHEKLIRVGEDSGTEYGSRPEPGEIFVPKKQ